MTIKPVWTRPLPACLLVAGLVGYAATVFITGVSSKPVLAADKAGDAATSGWDRQAAERYLDGREVWWQTWDRTQKDHGTYCISCHTQAPYGLARPSLRQQLGEPAPAGAERAMLSSIQKRVHMWKDVEPFYLDAKYGAGKEIQSRNAESVLNALILSSYDAHAGHLSDTTRMAFDNAWALQSTSGPTAGAWIWQNFSYTPWESPESEYHGAALMAVAVGKAPDGYRDDPKIAAHLTALTTYLNNHYEAQPLLNKVIALWASNWFPQVITGAQRSKLLEDVYGRQRADGGWCLTDLGSWERMDNSQLETRPDGYATGLTVLVLEESAATDAHLKARAQEPIANGVRWLKANQDKATGAWPAWSLNKNRDPNSDVGKFMSDAATSYAVLALDAKR